MFIILYKKNPFLWLKNWVLTRLVHLDFVLLPEPARAEPGLDVAEELLCFTDRPDLKNLAVLA